MSVLFFNSLKVKETKPSRILSHRNHPIDTQVEKVDKHLQANTENNKVTRKPVVNKLFVQTKQQDIKPSDSTSRANKPVITKTENSEKLESRKNVSHSKTDESKTLQTRSQRQNATNTKNTGDKQQAEQMSEPPNSYIKTSTMTNSPLPRETPKQLDTTETPKQLDTIKTPKQLDTIESEDEAEELLNNVSFDQGEDDPEQESHNDGFYDDNESDEEEKEKSAEKADTVSMVTYSYRMFDCKMCSVFCQRLTDVRIGVN